MLALPAAVSLVDSSTLLVIGTSSVTTNPPAGAARPATTRLHLQVLADGLIADVIAGVGVTLIVAVARRHPATGSLQGGGSDADTSDRRGRRELPCTYRDRGGDRGDGRIRRGQADVQPARGAGAEIFTVMSWLALSTTFSVVGVNVTLTCTFAVRASGAKPGGGRADLRRPDIDPGHLRIGRRESSAPPR